MEHTKQLIAQYNEIKQKYCSDIEWAVDIVNSVRQEWVLDFALTLNEQIHSGISEIIGRKLIAKGRQHCGELLCSFARATRKRLGCDGLAAISPPDIICGYHQFFVQTPLA